MPGLVGSKLTIALSYSLILVMFVILDFILYLHDFLLFLYFIWSDSKELVLSELSMDDFIQIIHIV